MGSRTGIAFGHDGRLYLTGFGAAADEIGVVTPGKGVGPPPVATGFATGTPGANGIAFDERGNLYASDGGTGQLAACSASGGREAPRRCSSASRRWQTLRASAARTRRSSRTLRPRRSGSWRTASRSTRTATSTWPTRRAARCGASSSGGAETSTRPPAATRCSCRTHSASTRSTSSTRPWTARMESHSTATATCGSTRNERNAIIIVERRGDVEELFRNPVVAGLRNAGRLEFPTSPVLAGRTLCTTHLDINRRDNAPNSAGEASPGTAVVGKVSCLDQRLDERGLEVPVDD